MFNYDDNGDFSIVKTQKSYEFVSFTGESKEYQEPAEFTSLRNTTIDFK